MGLQRLCVVTGATGGIGKWIALGMAQAGYSVVLAGRNRERGEAARAWIADQIPGCTLDLMLADLASLAETTRLARDITERYGRVDRLILNAGIFLARRQVTVEGHETVLAVNHLSPFVLIRELTPALKAAAPSRIVVVGSSTSDRAKIRLGDIELKHGWGMLRAYSQSKLAAMMTTFMWARRLKSAGVTANVVHPGMVASGLIRAPGVIGLAWRLMKLLAKPEQEGAKTPLFAALSEEYGAIGGLYLKNCRIARPNKLALDGALCGRVWQATERLVG